MINLNVHQTNKLNALCNLNINLVSNFADLNNELTDLEVALKEGTIISK